MGLWLVACGGISRDNFEGGREQEVGEAVQALAKAPPAPFTIPTDGVVATQPLGTISGSGSVSADGAFLYSIPLQVLPGRAGVQPSLTLQYSSRGPNGEYGLGWSVGNSRITRCKHLIAADGYADGLDFNTDYSVRLNQYCIDGNRLIATTATTGTVVYTTEHANFSKIVGVYQDTDNTGMRGDPLYFIVYTKDGQTLEYGARSDINKSQGAMKRWLRQASDTETVYPYTPPPIKPSPTPVTYAWHISRVSDVFGNTMTYRKTSLLPVVTG